MADISFIQRDFKGCPNRITGNFPITNMTLQDVMTVANNIEFLEINIAATSPASWSSGQYYLALRLDFYADDGPGYNTLIAQPTYPILQWASTEVNTVKRGSIRIPINALDKKYKLRVQLVSSFYTFTAIDGLIFIYGRTNQ